MGLKPLEFSDCLLDSPYFRDSIYDHEKELEQTNDAMKALIKECKNLVKTLDAVYLAQTSFCQLLKRFKPRYIGEVESEDDFEYEDSFPAFASILERVEQERKLMLQNASLQLIEPLERFRKEQIVNARDEKKKFDKETERVCSLLDNHLKLSPKKKDNVLGDADVQLEADLQKFREMSLSYVSVLQEVNERKKFEFSEILLSYMYGQQTFFHVAHEVFEDSKAHLLGLQAKLQTTRFRFDQTLTEAQELKTKTKKRFENGELHKESCSRQGYLNVLVKNWGGLGAQWVKHYCKYAKENKILSMIPYTQTTGKMNSNTDTLVVKSCTRKSTEASDRRFLFEIEGQDRAQPLLLQCNSEPDRRQWLEVMEGREPVYIMDTDAFIGQNEGVTTINDTGIEFFRKCVEAIEARGIEDQGLYRIAGVSSKFNKLLQTGLDPKQLSKLDLISENSQWEVKTITSAMKQYFRNLSEPLLTFKHHTSFVSAVKLNTKEEKLGRLKEVLKLLPERHQTVLNRLLSHLKMVSDHSAKNLMAASNLGVVLGPTLMRPKEETMAAIINIKFQSIVVETMIDNYEELFPNGPPESLTSTSVIATSVTTTKPGKPEPPQRQLPASSGSASPGKYHAPVPPSPASNKARPMVSPIQIDKESRRVSQESLSSVESISPSGSLKRHPHPMLKQRPTLGSSSDSPGALPSSKAPLPQRFAETVTPFTSPFDVAEEKEPAQISHTEMKSQRKNIALDIDDTKPALPTKPGVPPPIPRRKEWTVRTKYTCVAENDTELSFNAGAIIKNVRSSTEGGWLIGTLNGKTGLLPENYCEKID